MGVKQGWEKIRHCGEPVALARLGYDSIIEKKRRFRIAVDMGLWLKHADWGQGAAEPELRTILFRVMKLLDAGIAPLLVFDGPHRPKTKRGVYIWGGNHKLQAKILELAAALGVEVRQAPGEAEAEAALLAKEGIVDCVMSDDVDTLMFGAPVQLKNWSVNTSGAKAEEVARKDSHVLRYDAEVVAEKVPGMDADGLAFLALLSGGDYDDGLVGCGLETVIGLIRAKLHLPLLNALRTKRGQELELALEIWRGQVCAELRTNASGQLKTKKKALAETFPPSFPVISVADAYLRPVTSANTSDARFRTPFSRHTFDGRIDVAALVDIMTRRFEYNHAFIVSKITRMLRRPLLLRQLADMVIEGRQEVEWSDYMLEIPKGATMLRRHDETDMTPEYRLKLDLDRKWPYIANAEAHLVHPDPNIGKADEWRLRDNGPEAKLIGDFVDFKQAESDRIWIARALLERSQMGRHLIESWQDAQTAKKTGSSSPRKAVKKPSTSRSSSINASSPVRSQASSRLFSGVGSSQTTVREESDEEDGSRLLFGRGDAEKGPLGLESDGSLPDADVFKLAPSSPSKQAVRALTPIVIDLSDSDEPADAVEPGTPKRKRSPVKRAKPKPSASSSALFPAAAPPVADASRMPQMRHQSTLAFATVSKAEKGRSKTPPEPVTGKKKAVVVIDIGSSP